MEHTRAVELDPVSISIASSGGVLEYFARHYEVALEHYHRAAEIDSSSAFIHRLQAGALDRLGRQDEAVHELLRSLELQGQVEVAAGLGWIYRARGLRPTLETLISMLIQQRGLGGYQSAEHVAELYARLGQTDQGLEWLETAFREGDTELNRLKVDPIFDALRVDPRFDDLLRRVGLDQAGDPQREAT